MSLILAESQNLVEKEQVPETMQLTGHKAAVYSLDFSHDGEYMASAGFDR